MAKLGNALIVAEAVRRGLERQIYWTTWVLVGGFLVCSIANIWMTTHLK